jgi:hypothetical protein
MNTHACPVSQVQQLQHSLYVVRSQWGGLRQLLTRLHVMVQVRTYLQQIVCSWKLYFCTLCISHVHNCNAVINRCIHQLTLDLLELELARTKRTRISGVYL